MSQGFHQWLAVLRTLVTSDTPGFVGGGIADVENTLGSLRADPERNESF
jgi:hypothetical protein